MASATVAKRANVILFGDSITQQSFRLGGWGARLANYYSRRADVLNRGNSGYNTDWSLLCLESTFEKGSTAPILVTVFLGANDASDEKENFQQHVPLGRYKTNLKKIVDHIKSVYNPCPAIILIAPPPIEETQRLAYQKQRYKESASGKLERTLELSKQYASACESVGKEVKLPVINLWKSMMEEKDIKPFFWDGLHLTAKGNEFVYNMIIKTIAKEFPDIAVTADKATGNYDNSASSCPSLPPHYPWHNIIKKSDPAAAFPKK
mmetsp:Transcript_24252/g.36377  ORF Transcript_24252/g.36377 Transcript_24252/m.36377 type:complete len:264 (-) Transcript_24252:56-847(-)